MILAFNHLSADSPGPGFQVSSAGQHVGCTVRVFPDMALEGIKECPYFGRY